MSDTSDPRETPFHPRLRTSLLGHNDVERKLVSAHKSGRLHHAWLLSGAKGIGKATLAYRFARYVLRHGDAQTAPDSMHVDENDGVFKRVAARGHSDLLVVERAYDEKTKRLKAEIGVGEARSIGQFFTRTAGEGGWRVCIVDAADEMNATAANALLKILEEPPEQALILLVTQHSPGRVLATIRSRCIKQSMNRLDEGDVTRVLAEIGVDDTSGQLVKLAGGSPGKALELTETGAGEHLISLEALLGQPGPMDRSKLMRLADQLTARGQEQGYRAFCDVLREWLMRRASMQAHGVAPHFAQYWAQVHDDVGRSIDRANALNLDRRSVMLEAFRRIRKDRTHANSEMICE